MEPSLSPSYKFERMEEGEDGGGRRGGEPLLGSILPSPLH